MMIGKSIVVKQEVKEEQEPTRFDDQTQHNVSNAAEQQKIIAKTKVDERNNIGKKVKRELDRDNNNDDNRSSSRNNNKQPRNQLDRELVERKLTKSDSETTEYKHVDESEVSLLFEGGI